MAVVTYQRIVNGTSLSGKFAESLRCNERYQVRVDSPLTSKTEILGTISSGSGIGWGSPHWEFPALRAMEFDLSPVGTDGMMWLVDIQFYIPPRAPTENGIPSDNWERSGGTTTVPAFTDAAGDTITNSASDPLEGLSKEREESSWTLTKCYEDEADLNADVAAYSGMVNSGTWASGSAKTWKCYFKGASKKSISKLDGASDGETIDYVESRWEFRYDPTTWKLMPWDIGFMELVSGERKAILGDDGKPVKQPVALTPAGAAAAPGTAPSVINSGAGVDVYDTADWSTAFGSPTLL